MRDMKSEGKTRAVGHDYWRGMVLSTSAMEWRTERKNGMKYHYFRLDCSSFNSAPPSIASRFRPSSEADIEHAFGPRSLLKVRASLSQKGSIHRQSDYGPPKGSETHLFYAGLISRHPIFSRSPTSNPAPLIIHNLTISCLIILQQIPTSPLYRWKNN